MQLLLSKALIAKRESRQIEFKEAFDPTSAGDWCELVKDFVAIANSGGGIILFGLDSNGIPSGKSVEQIKSVDPAVITSKVNKYTGLSDIEFEVIPTSKGDHGVVAILIHSVSIPLIFENPGTYDVGNGKQKNAFSVGTIYFRHGAKSEPGTTEDIRKVIERQLEQIRKSWLKNVRKLVKAPSDAQFVSLPKGFTSVTSQGDSKIRIVKDPNATPIRLTRNRDEAAGQFVHEEISDGIFDEINNVVDANRALAKGQNKFFFGSSVYYRIYAERQHVQSSIEQSSLLFHHGVVEFYAPYIYWLISLPDNNAAEAIKELCLFPKSPQVHGLLRISVLLGPPFQAWLNTKWDAKWKRHSQPPAFYWTLKENSKNQKTDIEARIAAARVAGLIDLENGLSLTPKELINRPTEASSFLSRCCLKVFTGDNSYKNLARNLDYLTYGQEIQKRAGDLTRAIIKTVGTQKVMDAVDGQEP